MLPSPPSLQHFGEAKEEAPKKDGQPKGEEARMGKARKAPQQPDKATKTALGASEPIGSQRLKTKKDSPSDATAYRKTKARTQVQNQQSPRVKMV